MSLTLPHNISAVPALLSSSNRFVPPSSSGKSLSSPPVTILLSVYNGSATLDDALTSVYSQTYQNFLVTVVNDGSRDSTGFLLNAWQQKFGPARFHIITNPQNLGLTASLNIGIKTCTTPYLARLDADDTWLPDKLAKQLSFLEHHPEYGVVGCWYANVQKHTKRIFRLPITDHAIKRNMYRINPFGHSCVVIRRSLLDASSGYNPATTYSQDRDLWFRLAPLTSFYNLPQTLCHRQITGGISQTRYRRQMWQSIKIRWHYSRLYRAPIINYLFLLLPFLILLQPTFIKRLNILGRLPMHSNTSSLAASASDRLPLCVINDRPLLPHRGETIARQAMAAAFSSHPLIQDVTVININPYHAIFHKLHLPQVLYLRCGAVAAASISLRHWYSSQLILLEVHNLSFTQLSRLAIWLYRLAARRCDLLITIDPISTQAWLKLGAQEKNIIELPSGSASARRLSAASKNEIRKKYHLPLDQFLLVYSGNLYRDRGIELIFEAAHQLKHKPLHIALAGGSADDIKYYRHYLQEHWPSHRNISMLGLLPHHDVLPLLSSANLILVTYSKHCPTINTMSPLKFYEAISSGTPILAADFPRLRISCQPGQITFYKPDDLSDFVSRISQRLSSRASSTTLRQSSLTWSGRVSQILSRVLL